MHLARTVTHSTLAECQSRMSLAEFRHWQAMYRLEPWGDEWDQVRAQSAASLAPWSKRRLNLAKFFPQPPPPTSEQTEQLLQAFARRHNARVERLEQQRRGGQQPSPSSDRSRSPSRRTRRGSRGG